MVNAGIEFWKLVLLGGCAVVAVTGKSNVCYDMINR